jgi:hypothetical protein
MAQQPGAGESASEPRRWRIEPVKRDGEAGENYKVVFMHNGTVYELGFFSTREEGTRVADVLTSECAATAARDAHQPLNSAALREHRCCGGSQLAGCCLAPLQSLVMPSLLVQPGRWPVGTGLAAGYALCLVDPANSSNRWLQRGRGLSLCLIELYPLSGYCSQGGSGCWGGP